MLLGNGATLDEVNVGIIHYITVWKMLRRSFKIGAVFECVLLTLFGRCNMVWSLILLIDSHKIYFYLSYVTNRAFLAMLESKHFGNKEQNNVLQAQQSC